MAAAWRTSAALTISRSPLLGSHSGPFTHSSCSSFARYSPLLPQHSALHHCSPSSSRSACQHHQRLHSDRSPTQKTKKPAKENAWTRRDSNPHHLCLPTPTLPSAPALRAHCLNGASACKQAGAHYGVRAIGWCMAVQSWYEHGVSCHWTTRPSD